jgi:hypothetical protein
MGKKNIIFGTHVLPLLRPHEPQEGKKNEDSIDPASFGFYLVFSFKTMYTFIVTIQSGTATPTPAIKTMGFRWSSRGPAKTIHHVSLSFTTHCNTTTYEKSTS